MFLFCEGGWGDSVTFFFSVGQSKVKGALFFSLSSSSPSPSLSPPLSLLFFPVSLPCKRRDRPLRARAARPAATGAKFRVEREREGERDERSRLTRGCHSATLAGGRKGTSRAETLTPKTKNKKRRKTHCLGVCDVPEVVIELQGNRASLEEGRFDSEEERKEGGRKGKEEKRVKMNPSTPFFSWGCPLAKKCGEPLLKRPSRSPPLPLSLPLFA